MDAPAAFIRIPLNSTVYPEVVIPRVAFAPPSADALALNDGTEKGLLRAARAWSREAFVADPDGVRLQLSAFAARRALAAGVTDLVVGEDTADVDGYLRRRVVHDHPERFAPEPRESDKCAACGDVGPGFAILVPDAMLTPSEVSFLCEKCHHG